MDGTLPSGSRQGAESHLSRCRECREALAEVIEIRGRRVKIPREFLGRALEVPVENPRKGDTVPSRNVLPLRLAFGVAAVFLVALAVRYLFIGRGGGDMPGSVEKEMAERTVARERGRTPVPTEETGPTRQDAAVPGLEAPAAVVNDRNAEKKLVSAAGDSGPLAAAPSPKEAVIAAMPAKEARPQMVAEDDEALLLDREGGVVGGVKALPEKDKAAEMKLARSVPSAARAEELGENEMGIARQAAAPAQPMNGLAEKANVQRQRFAGGATAGDAMQLFLAATGRAAAPRLLRADTSPPPPPVRFAGDVEQEDLLDPWSPAGWEWLPAGSALEMTIAADGTVRAVELLGQWETRASSRAKAAAIKLAFSASGRETRRVVLSRDPVN